MSDSHRMSPHIYEDLSIELQCKLKIIFIMPLSDARTCNKYSFASNTSLNLTIVKMKNKCSSSISFYIFSGK